MPGINGFDKTMGGMSVSRVFDKAEDSLCKSLGFTSSLAKRSDYHENGVSLSPCRPAMVGLYSVNSADVCVAVCFLGPWVGLHVKHKSLIRDCQYRNTYIEIICIKRRFFLRSNASWTRRFLCKMSRNIVSCVELNPR